MKYFGRFYSRINSALVLAHAQETLGQRRCDYDENCGLPCIQDMLSFYANLGSKDAAVVITLTSYHKSWANHHRGTKILRNVLGSTCKISIGCVKCKIPEIITQQSPVDNIWSIFHANRKFYVDPCIRMHTRPFPPQHSHLGQGRPKV